MKKLLLFIFFLFSLNLIYSQTYHVEYCMIKKSANNFNPKELKGISSSLLSEVTLSNKSRDTTCFNHVLKYSSGKSSYIFSHIEKTYNGNRTKYSSIEYFKNIKKNNCVMISSNMNNDSQIEEKLFSSSEWDICYSDSIKILDNWAFKATHLKSNIIAWFSPEIPITDGPEKYGGLPGLILQLEIPKSKKIITAKKITINKETTEIEIPTRKNKITLKQYINELRKGKF